MAQADTHTLPAGTHPHALNWSAAIWASVIAGLVFAVLETILAPVARGASPWMPYHFIAAIGLGPGWTRFRRGRGPGGERSQGR